MGIKVNSPYAQPRKNLTLIVVWFIILGGILGVAKATVIPTLSKEGGLPLIGILSVISLACLGAMVPLGVKPLTKMLDEREPQETQLVQGKILTVGALAETPMLLGFVGWLLSDLWYLYAFGMVAIALVVLLILIPNINKHFDKLEMTLQRKKDGGVPATSKKTTYDL
jgi:ABC-type uncharacterized transport system YnjBCD permease subunit